MKSAWIVGMAIAASTSVVAETTIYKHVDESGHITYSNKPMKGAVAMELDPITTLPAPPAPVARAQPAAAASAPLVATALVMPVTQKSDEPKARPAVATLTPVLGTKALVASASVDAQLQRRRDNDRRRILEEELKSEEETLATVRGSVIQEQQNPQLIAAVRLAQQTADPTPTQLLEFRNAIDKASGRIRGLQATAAEHEKNVEALKKELAALKQ